MLLLVVINANYQSCSDFRAHNSPPRLMTNLYIPYLLLPPAANKFKISKYHSEGQLYSAMAVLLFFGESIFAVGADCKRYQKHNEKKSPFCWIQHHECPTRWLTSSFLHCIAVILKIRFWLDLFVYRILKQKRNKHDRKIDGWEKFDGTLFERMVWYDFFMTDILFV